MALLDRPRRWDVLVAVALLVWALPDVPWWWRGEHLAISDPAVPGYLAIALAQSVPFLWRRRFPLPMLLLTCGLLATRAGLGKDLASVYAATLAAAYGLGAYTRAAFRTYVRWFGWLVVGASFAAEQVNLAGDRRSVAAGVLFGVLTIAGLLRTGTSGRPAPSGRQRGAHRLWAWPEQSAASHPAGRRRRAVRRGVARRAKRAAAGRAGRDVRVVAQSAVARHSRASDAFSKYRLLLNYCYLFLTRLGITPVQRFLLCHLVAGSVDGEIEP